MRPDLVHAHLSAATLTGSIAGQLARVPVVATVHGMNRKWTYMFARHLIAVSEAGKRNLVAQGIAAERISVAYYGTPIPGRMADKASAREQLDITSDSPIVGSVSRADFSKGIQTAINAIA